MKASTRLPFSLMSHEVLFELLEALVDAFSNRDGRHDDHVLHPTVLLVQLVNRLDVRVGLADTRLHLHGKIDTVPFEDRTDGPRGILLKRLVFEFKFQKSP